MLKSVKDRIPEPQDLDPELSLLPLSGAMSNQSKVGYFPVDKTDQ